MLGQYDKYTKTIDQFIEKNKKVIGRMVNFNVSDLNALDLRVYCNYMSYKAGPEHFQKKGDLDPTFLDDVRIAPSGKKYMDTFIKALSWYEKGVISQRKLSDVATSIPKFTPRIERLMAEEKKGHYRESFSKMRESVQSLGDCVRQINQLFRERQSLSNPEFRDSLKETIKDIHNSISRCEYRAKAGFSWAIQQGVPFDKAHKAIDEIYLKHIRSLSKFIEPVDRFLNTQGVQSNLADRADSISNKWDCEIEAARNRLIKKGFNVESKMILPDDEYSSEGQSRNNNMDNKKTLMDYHQDIKKEPSPTF